MSTRVHKFCAAGSGGFTLSRPLCVFSDRYRRLLGLMRARDRDHIARRSCL